MSTAISRFYSVRAIRGAIALLLVLASLLFAFAGAGLAARTGTSLQTQPFDGQPSESPAPLNASNISSEKVTQFVNAYLQVLDLIEQREDELQQAETTSESQQVTRDIETQANQIIADSGLTRQEYLQLLSLANTDAEFGERIATQIQEVKD
jgi:hypothetical protein